MLGRNFIGDKFSAEGTISFQSKNPKSGELSSIVFYQATDEELQCAVNLANEAFKSYNFSSSKQKSTFLLEIAQQLKFRKVEILEAFSFESGLSTDRADAEFARTIFQIQSFAEALSSGKFSQRITNQGESNFLAQVPSLQKHFIGIGPIVVFGASNFPLAYSAAGGDTISALAAGCPVIVKAHPLHPHTSGIVANAIVKAIEIIGLPAGVFSHLYSTDFSVGERLVLHPKVKGVGFTGSLKGGRALFDLANSRLRPIPVFAEMGSVNPVIVLPDYLENTFEGINLLANAITNDAGQFCTKPGILFIPKGLNGNEFVANLCKKVLAKPSQVMLGEGVHQKFKQDKAIVLGLDVLNIYEKNHVPTNEGGITLVEVLSAQFIAQKELQEEVFGPFSVLVRYADFEELNSCLDVIEASLTASVFTSQVDLDLQNNLIKKLSVIAGRIILNGVPTGVIVSEAMTHGGPYPASTDSRFSAVGLDSIKRWLRPVTYQNFPI